MHGVLDVSDRTALTEIEALEIAREMGIHVPRCFVVRDAAATRALDLDALAGTHVVVKIVSQTILHKSDVGGVGVVAKDHLAIADAVDAMARRFDAKDVQGFAVVEFVDHDLAFGSELLLGVRWTDDFGAVVTLAPGGIQTEHLARHLRPESALALYSPGLARLPAGADPLEGTALGPLVTRPFRGRAPRVSAEALRALLNRVLDVAATRFPDDLVDFEINPLVFARGVPVALDALAHVGRARTPHDAHMAPPRPLFKMARLLEPRSIAIVGVSERMNPGHVILRNVLDQGFPSERVWVVKPGVDTLDGCSCFPSVSALPAAADLLVLAVDAAQSARLIAETIESRKAESVIVIPGGLGEREATQDAARHLADVIHASRETDWSGPLVNGPNCLGIRSQPGHYDTMFIPGHKVGIGSGPVAPLAVIAQSGAFAIARANRMAGLNPRYMISIGNQMDLTAGDYLEYLSGDPAVRVFACYVEGFRPGDGLRWLEAAARIVDSRRTVVLYRAGRTTDGTVAAASHTASVAGDYVVTRELSRRAGVVVAETLADFDDLVRMFTLMREKTPAGARLGVISNAGFECVVMADHAGGMQLASFAPKTVVALDGLLRSRQLDGIVTVHNPLDVTPILDDASYEDACRIVLDDPNVDAAVLGCVPMTPALSTLPASPGHLENASADSAVGPRLARLAAASSKPTVIVVDGGRLYDPMVAAIEAHGAMVFRTADRAMRLLDIYCRSRSTPP